LAALACVCFIAALLLSAAFLSLYSHHEHDHNGADGGCATCACISAAGNLLKTVSSAVAASVVAVGATFFALRTLEAERFEIADRTLISLKIRLNN
jgi:hypothetical protein